MKDPKDDKMTPKCGKCGGKHKTSEHSMESKAKSRALENAKEDKGFAKGKGFPKKEDNLKGKDEDQ